MNKIFRKSLNPKKKIIKNKPINNLKNKILVDFKIEIPADIYQTWHTKDLPPLMRKSIEKLKLFNPRFNYYLFDENECREFIKNNFDYDILNAYDSLIPSAYKTDLWRYCILYKKGGIYLDIKYCPINGFRFINLLKKEHFVLENGGGGVYNALLICKPGNEILLKAINQIVLNVKNKFYGDSCLEPTGPNLLGKFFSEHEKNSFDLSHLLIGSDVDNRFILLNKYPILKCYNGYSNEKQSFGSRQNYGDMWNSRNIYR